MKARGHLVDLNVLVFSTVYINSNPFKDPELDQIRKWCLLSDIEGHIDNFACNRCVQDYRQFKDKYENISHAGNDMPYYVGGSCYGKSPLCELLGKLNFDKTGFNGASRLD